MIITFTLLLATLSSYFDIVAIFCLLKNIAVVLSKPISRKATELLSLKELMYLNDLTKLEENKFVTFRLLFLNVSITS